MHTRIRRIRRYTRIGLATVALVVGTSCGRGTQPGSHGTSPTRSLSLVGLGDSLPGALGCACPGYVELYGKAAASALAADVTVTNLATNDGVDSGQLLVRIRSDQTYRDALASADLITLQIGFNDWRTCNWPGDDACWVNGTTGVEQNLTAALEEVQALRGGKSTEIRVLTYPDMWIGAVPSPQPPFLGDSAFQNYFAGQLVAFNAMTCRVAEAWQAVCIDLVKAFNGPEGNDAPTGLIGPDNKHPTAAGHELIAETLDAAGYG